DGVGAAAGLDLEPHAASTPGPVSPAGPARNGRRSSVYSLNGTSRAGGKDGLLYTAHELRVNRPSGPRSLVTTSAGIPRTRAEDRLRDPGSAPRANRRRGGRTALSCSDADNRGVARTAGLRNDSRAAADLGVGAPFPRRPRRRPVESVRTTPMCARPCARPRRALHRYANRTEFPSSARRTARRAGRRLAPASASPRAGIARTSHDLPSTSSPRVVGARVRRRPLPLPRGCARRLRGPPGRGSPRDGGTPPTLRPACRRGTGPARRPPRASGPEAATPTPRRTAGGDPRAGTGSCRRRGDERAREAADLQCIGRLRIPAPAEHLLGGAAAEGAPLADEPTPDAELVVRAAEIADDTGEEVRAP